MGTASLSTQTSVTSRSFASHADLSQFRSSVQLQQKARSQNKGRTPVQSDRRSSTSPERTHLASTFLFSRVTVNTLQPHTPINIEYRYSTINTISAKAYPSRSASIVFRHELTVTNKILTPNTSTAGQSSMMHTDHDTATYTTTSSKSLISQID